MLDLEARHTRLGGEIGLHSGDHGPALVPEPARLVQPRVEPGATKPPSRASKAAARPPSASCKTLPPAPPARRDRGSRPAAGRQVRSLQQGCDLRSLFPAPHARRRLSLGPPRLQPQPRQGRAPRSAHGAAARAAGRPSSDALHRPATALCRRADILQRHEGAATRSSSSRAPRRRHRPVHRSEELRAPAPRRPRPASGPAAGWRGRSASPSVRLAGRLEQGQLSALG